MKLLVACLVLTNHCMRSEDGVGLQNEEPWTQESKADRSPKLITDSPPLLLPVVSDSVYVRWGKSSCVSYYIGSQLLYSGFVGGASTDASGGGSGYLCLPSNPQHLDSELVPHGAEIHGTEYHVDWSPFTLPADSIRSLRYHNVPCAVCTTPNRPFNMMLPGRSFCGEGWTREYNGYLMSGSRRDAGRQEYVCVDSSPDLVPWGFRRENGSAVHVVEVKCGSLSCPPYYENREVPCVVCSQ